MRHYQKILGCTAALALSVSLVGCAAEGTPVLTAAATAETTAAAVQAAAVSDGVTIRFTNTGVTASEAGNLEIDGTSVSITGAGTYILSGSCGSGSVKVKKGVTGVTLVLNGLDLTAQDTAPIVCAKSTEVTIEAAAGTDNRLSDTESNNEESGNTDAENAVLKCKDGSRVTLCGTGSLTVEAKGKNGIKSGASTQEEGDASLTIRDLTLTIDAPVNDAINAESDLNVESGTLTVSAGDDAIHSDTTLNVGAKNTQGPTITITGCYEGLEGATVNVCSGNVSILSTDDCINAANPDLTNYDYSLNISGGTVTAYSTTGDGFDSNGSMTISGGTVAVWTANTADNSPLDADGTVTISGGTLLAAGGSSGMGMNLSAQQPCVTFTGSGSTEDTQNQGKKFGFGGSSFLSEGSAFTVSDSQGNALYSGEAKCNTSFLLFSSDALAADETYTLSGGSSQLTAQAQSGTVKTGMGGMGGMGGGPRGDGQKPENFDPSQKPDKGGFDPGSKPEGQPPEPPQDGGNQ